MPARRHHYVPESYLNAFADDTDRPKLQVFDLKTGKSFGTSPDNVAVKRDFNRVNIPGRPIDELEGMLGQIEGDVITAIRRIQKARTLDQLADLHLVLNLVGLLAVRNPRFRQTMNDSHNKVAKGLVRLCLETPERYAETLGRPREGQSDVSYADMKAFVSDDKFTMGLDQNHQIGLELSLVRHAIDWLAARKWSLLRAPTSTGGFVTCDHPVCLNYIKPTKKSWAGPGLMTPGTNILFPLSRELCLMGEFEMGDIVADVDFQAVARMNGAIVANAERQVYACDDRFIFFRPDETLPTFGYNLPALCRKHT